MVKVSTAKKIAVAGRVAVQQLTRNRTGAAVLGGLRVSGRHFGRALKQLWLEVTGFTFLVLAGIGAIAGFNEYAKYHSGQSAGPGRLIVAVCFTASFTWFGLSSFWRVKRKS